MKTERKFFAAANGYKGFKSFFDSTFNSAEYSRIYVLKGGPGTGKSSFMKSMGNALIESGADCEAIYCSSDPKSLDGIIAENGENKIAVIDGTAPHERDAVIPGAIDEIINLGTSWNTSWLSAQRKEILELNDEKKKAYNTAYSYLRVCGSISDEKKKLCAVSHKNLKEQFEKTREEIFIDETVGKIETRLISSFGKYGNYRLDTIENISQKLYSIVGDRDCALSFMKNLYEELKSSGVHFIHCPAPLDHTETEAIYLPNKKIGYIIASGGEEINAEEYITASGKADHERIRKLTAIEDTVLEEAKRWFSIASDFHFRLEAIYSRCMDFQKSDDLLTSKLNEAKKILGLSQ